MAHNTEHNRNTLQSRMVEERNCNNSKLAAVGVGGGGGGGGWGGGGGGGVRRKRISARQ